jgi:hypothetical protein
MDDGFQMGVVIVKDVTRHAVDEGRIHDVEALAASEQRGLRRAGKRRQCRHRDIDGLMMRSSDRDADPVQQRSHAFPADIGRKIVILRGDQIMGEGAGDVFRRDGLGRGSGRGVGSLRECRARGGHSHWKRCCGLQHGPAIGDRHI